jgi:ATP-binding cassette subfamily E protein 1
MRIAVVNRDKCNPQGCGDYLCVRVCPINKTGEECIIKEKKAKIFEEKCIGCGICTQKCPFQAIDIINLPEELTRPPIHRYGQNGFHLYGLPIPIFGKVVGIIGRNGIGKSTAINILSGILKPNLGRNDVANVAEVISYFKGTEGQNYFERLRDGQVKVSYKLQQVDQIPKVFKGTIFEFLNKVSSSTDKIKQIAKELDIENILDSKMDVISGGELQRAAIAATVLKDANVYFFDEPTSFLDIKQRMKVAKFIKNLAEKKTEDGKDIAVVVIEHDLIILDYMTDLIHAVYGKEDVYGIVSLAKSSKGGINEFLHGFLRQENIRFRNYEIRFDKRIESKHVNKQTLTEWTALKKKLGSFELFAEGGIIHKQDSIGVLGENGIGKTTFIKILAKVIETDSGEISTGVKVSYKPQYIETNSDELVMSYLKEAILKYKAMLLKPLDIEPLMMKQLNQLSGGQLQRVSIAKALSQDAELFLLDEPSAYLDVEQRLVISKVVHDWIEVTGKTVVVVDHDLLFLDYISEKIIVFDGVPSKNGIVKGPFGLQEGMNSFLESVGITYRRDEENNRPRANKEGSQMDQMQKKENKYYYI